jgi:superfamily II DNA or RNA helicase
MATGLGKTWLAAFDSVGFDRVLFVAHREEILNQALNTFRKIRPDANLGLYMGGQYDTDADVLFASIQTLGRANHLRQFSPERFDYIVVDEFHHAAASTYRRLIDYFEPNFMLGLTATPERTDGGDLLALCGENLVFRCDLIDGIERKLLCPFAYFGVPDEVDFSNIPWRSGRFDPQALEFAVATDKRAQNAFEQWQKHGQSRTLAFCASKQHADFMADFFGQRGVKTVAVHSGPSSAPRANSLENLERGELQVVFAVDMFNEGVDVPTIDTVMMLRPTESKILWLQQFGRGLRSAAGKSRLNVIDYIGNHKTFLKVPALLFPNVGDHVGEVRRALAAWKVGELELPPDCSVEYELEAIEILEKLAKPLPLPEQTIHWYQSFREIHGRRPTASEAYHEGYDPKLRKK